MIKNIKKFNRKIIWFTPTTKLLVWGLSVSLAFLFCVSLVTPALAGGASLYLSPSRGTFFVGSTFSVSIYVDTKGNEINAVEIDLRFPPKILQITAPTTGESFISEWLTPPSYSNVGGTISFKGGIPGGITTSAGLVSTITFRASSPGIAKVEFLDSSRVLLNDGKGTPIFAILQPGVYEILVPPPEGPKIFSNTHLDSDIWYSNSSPSFFWEKEEGTTDFSFSLSQNPRETPDTISVGDVTSKSYERIPDGIWYFHLRAKTKGVWGQTSHFALKIDTAPPNKFELRIDTTHGLVYFETKDFHSGIEHYEVSATSLEEIPAPAPFFVEATSPFKTPFEKPGKYSIVVRAYDRAGNSQLGEARFQKVSPFLSFIEGRGIEIKGVLFTWRLIYLILFIFATGIIVVLVYLLKRQKGFEKGVKEIEEAIKEIERIEVREKGVEELKRRFEEEKRRLEEKLKHEA